MKIPPVDLQRQYQQIGDRLTAAVLAVLNSGRYVGGQTVVDFEQSFGEYIGSDHCLACNSGTDALILALLALDIGAGDEVITSPFTFVATSETICRVGAKPVFVDIDSQFNLDLDQLEAAINPRTKAVIPVHLFGQPVDMTRLKQIAQAHSLYLIEDCAQATGAAWQGQKVGAWGDVGCFSFFPTKNLGACGDGGAVTTNNPEIAAKIKALREHGQTGRYRHDYHGINSRLDTIQAAILQIKLPDLDRWNRQRREIATRYSQLLQPVTEIELPYSLPGGSSVWNQYTIRVKSGDRNRLRDLLQQMGVVTMIYYPTPLHLQPVYQSLGYQSGQLPQAELASSEVLSLPMFPDLTVEEQQQVVYCLKDALTQLQSKV